MKMGETSGLDSPDLSLVEGQILSIGFLVLTSENPSSL